MRNFVGQGMASGHHRLPFTPPIRNIAGSPYTIAKPQSDTQRAATYNYQPHQIQPAQDHNFNVLENLSDKEGKIITDVFNRDESVRQRDAARLM